MITRCSRCFRGSYHCEHRRCFRNNSSRTQCTHSLADCSLTEMQHKQSCLTSTGTSSPRQYANMALYIHSPVGPQRLADSLGAMKDQYLCIHASWVQRATVGTGCSRPIVMIDIIAKPGIIIITLSHNRVMSIMIQYLWFLWRLTKTGAGSWHAAQCGKHSRDKK